ncbi:MAG: hypothetical protein GXP30_01100, partial [Verrucomicrobia bacterium]|nr:hypothetical protein [Verrucomicrobiota bacterium]
MALQLRQAISAYHTEYRKYPIRGEGKEDVDLQSDHKLMDVLIGSDNAAEKDGLNPRRIAFFYWSNTKHMIRRKFKGGIK